MNRPVVPAPKDQLIPSAENLLKIVLLIAVLVASFAATSNLVDIIDRSLSNWIVAWTVKGPLILAMAVINGVLVLGLAVLSHDAVHRVLFRSGFWNDLWGGVLAALALIPFYVNRQIHLTHHSYAHQPDHDPENRMHHRSFWSACTVGSLVGLQMHYDTFFRNLGRIADPRYTGRILKDIVFVSIAGVFYFVLMPRLGISLAATVVPMILVFPLVFAWRAISDHYGIPAIERERFNGPVLEVDAEAWHRDRAKRQGEVAGWVVRTSPLLEWIWSHVNYHEVHHKFPWLSHHHLPAAFEATRAVHPYMVVDGYWKSFLTLRKKKYYESPESAQVYPTVSRAR